MLMYRYNLLIVFIKILISLNLSSSKTIALLFKALSLLGN